MADPRVPAAASEGMGKGPLSLQLVHQASQYPHTDIIVLASGTGVDTMRAFLTSWGPAIGDRGPGALVWLILGVGTWDIVEAGDWQKIQEGHDEQFRVTAARYHEMASGSEGALFLENKLGLESYRYEVFDRLHAGGHIFAIEEGFDELARGVVVVGTAPGSAAERLGLRRGDLVVEVNDRPIDRVNTLERARQSASGSWTLSIRRDDRVLTTRVQG